MHIEEMDIPDVILIRPQIFPDSRGVSFQSWHEAGFIAAGLDWKFVVDNHVRSVRHSLRGLHYQVQRPQGKLLTVTHGRAFDVAVDLRKSSPSFGRWIGVELSDENQRVLWIPPGFAHGILAMSDFAHFVYRSTDYRVPEFERSIAWDDAEIGINWPIPAHVSPILSGRDERAPPFSMAECFS